MRLLFLPNPTLVRASEPDPFWHRSGYVLRDIPKQTHKACKAPSEWMTAPN